MSKKLYLDPAAEKKAAEVGQKNKAPSEGGTVQTKKTPGRNSLSSGGAFFGRDVMSRLGNARTMPESVQSQMESALGADFSDVKLYESPVVSEGGAMAAASGKQIAFAPGKLDFGSSTGMELLGHELSHVASQARGEVGGHGLVNHSALEHQADLDGKKAASFSAMDSASGKTLTPMSTGMSGMSVAAPVQTKKHKDKSKGELFTEGYNSLDNVSDQVDAMINMSMVNSYDQDMDESENDAYLNIVENQITPEFISQLVGQQFAAGKATADLKRTLAAQGMSEDEASARAKYSPEMTRYQSISTLMRNVFMLSKDSDALMEQHSRMQDQVKKDTPEQYEDLITAQTILGYEGKARRNDWSTQLTGGTTDGGRPETNAHRLRDMDSARNVAAAKAWQRPRKKRNLFQKMFGL